MNTFSIRLETVNERGTQTGNVVEFRSACDGIVELVIARHKPGPKGGTKAEESLGRLHDATLVRVLQAIHILTPGGTEA